MIPNWGERGGGEHGGPGSGRDVAGAGQVVGRTVGTVLGGGDAPAKGAAPAAAGLTIPTEVGL